MKQGCNKNRHTSVLRSPLPLLFFCKVQILLLIACTLGEAPLSSLYGVLNPVIQNLELWQDGDISIYL